MGRSVRGVVAPSVCGPPRVRRGPLPGSWGLCPDPEGVLPQSEWHSPGAGPGPRAQAVRLPAQGMRTVEPFLREGRSEGVCHICVLGWPPSPATAWGLHGEADWRLLGASDRTGKGSAQDSQDELRGGVRWDRRVRPTRPLPWSTQCPHPAGRLLPWTTPPNHGVAGEGGQVARDTVLCPGCTKPAPDCFSGRKVSVQERPAPCLRGLLPGAPRPESFFSLGLPSIPRLGRA